MTFNSHSQVHIVCELLLGHQQHTPSRAVCYENNSFCTEWRCAEELAETDEMAEAKNVPELLHEIAGGDIKW